MAKDDRNINSGIWHEGTKYLPDMEDELAAVLSQEQLDHLVKEGALAGKWASKAGGKAPAKDADTDAAKAKK